jgi:hypothetical protein
LSGNRWLAIFQFRKVITFSEFSFVITFTIWLLCSTNWSVLPL